MQDTSAARHARASMSRRGPRIAQRIGRRERPTGGLYERGIAETIRHGGAGARFLAGASAGGRTGNGAGAAPGAAAAPGWLRASAAVSGFWEWVSEAGGGPGGGPPA